MAVLHVRMVERFTNSRGVEQARPSANASRFLELRTATQNLGEQYDPIRLAVRAHRRPSKVPAMRCASRSAACEVSRTPATRRNPFSHHLTSGVVSARHLVQVDVADLVVLIWQRLHGVVRLVTMLPPVPVRLYVAQREILGISPGRSVVPRLTCWHSVAQRCDLRLCHHLTLCQQI